MGQSRLISYNKQIDGLRCIAVICVVVFHLIQFDNTFLKRLPLGQGVNLFFVISGYLITKILLVNKERISEGTTTIKSALKGFFLRRFLRIFPIYYLTIGYLYYIDFEHISEIWPWLVSYTTNIHAYTNISEIGTFLHLWSLAVEEQFYLFWPLLIFMIPKRFLGKLIIGSILLALVYKICFIFLIKGHWFGVNGLTIGCMDSLGFGALIGYLSIYKPQLLDKINSKKYLIGVSFIPFVLVAMFPRYSNTAVSILSNFLYSFFAFFVVAKAAQNKLVIGTKFVLENWLVIHIGKISYAIYLFHFFMPSLYIHLAWTYPNDYSLDSPYRKLFYFVVTFALAQGTWMFIEWPLMQLKSYVSYSKKAPPPHDS